jgi:hypothetical protein
MVVGLGLLTVLALAVAPARPAAAQVCPVQDQAVDVHFDTAFDTARVDHTRSKAQIQRMFLESEGRATIPAGSEAVGLTVTHTEFRFRTSTQLYLREDGRYCVYLRGVRANLNQNDTVVYIAREYPKATCPYDVTYAHEKRHVAVYYYTHRDFAPRIEAELRRLVATARPRLADTREQGRTLHASELNDALSGLLSAMDAERRRRNAALDTPENYERERAKCPSW